MSIILSSNSGFKLAKDIPAETNTRSRAVNCIHKSFCIYTVDKQAVLEKNIFIKFWKPEGRDRAPANLVMSQADTYYYRRRT